MENWKDTKNDLFRNAMENQWSEVFKTLEEDRGLRTAKVTATGDTVLHMAMYALDETVVVAAMVDLVLEDEESSERSYVLEAANVKGNTPLHLAASIGNIEMCKKIGGVNPSLIATRNEAGETPLFLAALHGQRKAFLWLHYLYMEIPGVSSTNYAHCIRDNKDTILHCAIAEEHLDVAIEIIHLYKDLVKRSIFNDEGLSPLHLLAEKPSAFKSGALLGRPFGHLAYHLLGDMTKNKATTKEELEKEDHKSCVMALKDACPVSVPVILG
ncbi:serine/threonine-protein phosphatase 6 regulatory ankyrin repeat subunit C-like [Neltuma alba]|uniref:serine/threonine-protein phosphatase 6 regulatory ankyrin repeat subunit C-like n=1 Tax=Neltuma alba TaxID=207710 RepID=UPI0010A46A1C|nr:serine/threonine-protein phosphatase 6 regulatory ankyrin repeat subunit C-like [Prosopis alba]